MAEIKPEHRELWRALVAGMWGGMLKTIPWCVSRLQ
jgi:hypothetical protein